MPVREMKTIRIDSKTQIEVPVTISDEDARERFYFRNKGYSRYIPVTANYPLKNEFKEVEVPQEELASIIDDSELPEIE